MIQRLLVHGGCKGTELVQVQFITQPQVQVSSLELIAHALQLEELALHPLKGRDVLDIHAMNVGIFELQSESSY
jgi:hypothetical protein